METETTVESQLTFHSSSTLTQMRETEVLKRWETSSSSYSCKSEYKTNRVYMTLPIYNYLPDNVGGCTTG